MCGIVMCGAAHRMSSKDIELFEKLLMCDTFRGVHSTGVMSLTNFEGNDFIDVTKAAVDGPKFLDSEAWIDHKLKHYTEYKPAVGNTTYTVKTPVFMVGHNRHATMGAKTTQNAHPFQVGNVTLVHNGTLRNQSLLPDYKDFEVDSHNIAHAIDKEGINATVQKLQGAYTLIWHDKRDNTLNILRNSERPFHLAKNVTGDWFGASEEDMLMWILQREAKYGMNKRTPPSFEHFECEVGTQYVFDVSDDKFKFKEEIKHELPTFQTTYHNYNRGSRGWGYYYDDYEDDYPYYNKKTDYKNAARQRVEDAANDLLIRCGVTAKVGDTLEVSSYTFEQYKNSTLGLMECYVEGINEFVLVKAHGIKAADYKPYSEYKGTISSVYEKNEQVVITIAWVKPVVEKEEKEPEVVMEDDEVFTKSQWEKSVLATCGCCYTHIPFDEADKASVYGTQGYICWQCSGRINRSLGDSGLALLPAPKTFTCEECKEVCDLSEEADFLAGHCEDCADRYYNLEERKELDNGAFVTKVAWEKMNKCCCCGYEVPFSDATFCYVSGDAITCINCM